MKRVFITLSSIVITAGCAQLQPIKGNGRFLLMRDAYGEVVVQIDTPSPKGCIAMADATKRAVSLFSSLDLECADKSLVRQLPWLVSETNQMTATEIIYRFGTKPPCMQMANEVREKMSAEQKKIYIYSGCKADPYRD